MSDFPHIYTTTTQGTTATVLHLKSESLPDLEVAPPGLVALKGTGILKPFLAPPSQVVLFSLSNQLTAR